MRERFVLGPILIVLIVVGLALDQAIDHMAMPAFFGPRLAAPGATAPPGVVLLPIMLLVAILGARELASLLAAKGIVGSRRIMSLSAFIGLALSSLLPASLSSTDAVAAVSTGSVTVLAAALAFQARNKSVQGVLAAAGAALLAFVYLGLMFGFLLAIRREHSAWVLLWILLVVKAFDIGAFFTGRAIGRHKMIEWLSPKKTWEGVVGGLAVSALLGALGRWLLVDQGLLVPTGFTGHLAWVLLGGALAGVLFGGVGQIGDLMASLLKRDAGVTDSGVVPGFGGVIDIIDSPLLVAPVAYWWLAVTG